MQDGIDEPDQANPGGEVLLDLGVDVPERVAARNDLDGEVGGEVGVCIEVGGQAVLAHERQVRGAGGRRADHLEGRLRAADEAGVSCRHVFVEEAAQADDDGPVREGGQAILTFRRGGQDIRHTLPPHSLLLTRRPGLSPLHYPQH